jgi:hypothetical protein
MREKFYNKMKLSIKRTTLAAIMGIIGIGLLTSVTFGADISELIRVYRNAVILEVNNKRVTVDNFVVNGTTYVPLRAVSELLGKDVGWNAITNIASINDLTYQKEALSKLLPPSAGYKWIYNGFAEYGHQMTLNSVTDETSKRTYNITGTVEDPSGGESTADLRINMQYIIEKTSMIQQKSEQVMMDSKFNRMTLIKTPLAAGTYWTEKVTDKAGLSKDIAASITKVTALATGVKEYTVHYKDINSPYYEERVIREGVGVVSFEKLLELGSESFTAGYFLYEPENFVNVNLTLYFADSNADKLRPEIRTVPVYNSRTAWTAIQELIAGPKIAGLKPPIPIGTTVLDLGISNGICTVNFSREFIDNHSGGSAGELITLGSIVNTLTEFPTIQKVVILVDGKAGETLGNIVLDHPLERMPNMIAK